MNLYCKTYQRGTICGLEEVELPEAVQHNANGDRVIIEVRNNMDETCQVVFENDEHGDLTVSLRGWGNKPAVLGNWNRTTFEATIPLEPPTSCGVCGTRLENNCGCA